MTEKKTNKPSCFSCKIDLSLSDRLKKDLLEQGFTLAVPAYTKFQAKKKGLSITLYESGALTVQGKDKESFIEFYLEPEILRDFSYSYPKKPENMTPHIGVDEAGKGDFFGPLCTVGVYADTDQIEKLFDLGVRDSKSFSDAGIIKIGEKIKKIVTYHSVVLYPEKYNELYGRMKNLNFLLAWCHATCIDQLVQKTNCKEVIIDQFAHESIVPRFLKNKGQDLSLKQVVRAESDLVVGAASILARMLFLQGLEKLSEKYNLPLAKGASSKVIETGKAFAFRYGIDKLPEVGKKHFKTFQEIEKAISI